MKHILLILSLFGLAACSKRSVKNNTPAEIYAAGSLIAANECGEVTSGWFGDFPVMFHKVEVGEGGGKEPGDPIGSEDGYSEVSHYVVNNDSQEASAVTAVEEDPCVEEGGAEEGHPELDAAKQAAVEAAEAAKQAAYAAKQAADDAVAKGGPPTVLAPAGEKQRQATEIQAKADAVVAEANAADTVETANAAKEKADAIKEEAEALF